MKLILTEEQLNLLLQTEGVARLLQESLGDSKNLENLKGIIRKLLATGVALTTIVAALWFYKITHTSIFSLTKIEKNAKSRHFEIYLTQIITIRQILINPKNCQKCFLRDFH